ncbi:hypothetical protein GORBP_077_00510 [Gordonia rubripertincta NBRC 101908]|uniref:Thioesterase domain-containing protein n=1 Tax=Gordonia rubripertincta NBRC 101908 TaxID=1077975 RepID=A0ABQ0HWL0_GORRU|nr:hypothetical protein GORBP_077_00510 [Gordonia rubripertincta NBRC 101908]
MCCANSADIDRISGHTQTVKSYAAPISHRPERDGTVPASAHVPFYLAMEYSSDAWNSLLVDTCGAPLPARDLGVVDVTAQFNRELFVGDVCAETGLIRLGVSSLGFRVVLYQEDVVCAVITIVLARLAPDRKRSTPLTAEQRTALETILET